MKFVLLLLLPSSNNPSLSLCCILKLYRVPKWPSSLAKTTYEDYKDKQDIFSFSSSPVFLVLTFFLLCHLLLVTPSLIINFSKIVARVLLYTHSFISDASEYKKRSINLSTSNYIYIFQNKAHILSFLTMLLFSWTTIEIVSRCFCIILIILLTIGGNLVVLFAFYNDSRLLTPSNNFLLSMAIADLLVGLIAMPFHS